MAQKRGVRRKSEGLDLDGLRDMFDQHRIESGQRVRNRRQALGMTATLVASTIGVPLQTVSKVELGEILPRDYLRAAIACVLLCEVEELWPYPPRSELTKVAV